MIPFLKSRWALLLVLMVFIICKIPYLHYPYYWDESWPYAPAIREMYNHGISLMPNAISAELSRGHPLFFHVIAATWMRIFGSSHIAMHSFALTISILFLVAIYEAGLRLFNHRVAVLSLLLVATQVIFFVQSSFVMLEVLVTFLCFLSIYFYSKDKYLPALLCLTALFYTKESGLVVGLVLGLDAFIGLLNKRVELKKRLLRLAIVSIPVALIAAYFIIQKQVRGWYVFPLHLDYIDYNWNSFWNKFRIVALRCTFYTDIKFYYFLILMALSVTAAIKNRSAKYLSLLIPAAIIYYIADDKRTDGILPSVPLFILFVLSVFYFLYVYSNSKFFAKTGQRRFIVLTGLFVFCFLCFSSLNFLTYRYLLAAIVPLLFLTAVFYDLLMAHSFKALYYPLLGCILLISFFAFRLNDGYGDCNFGAFDGMDVQQAAVTYMEDHNYYNKAIGTGSFLANQGLTNPACGYLKSDNYFKNVCWDIDRKTDFALFDKIGGDSRYDSMKKDTSFHCVFRSEKGKMWVEIYSRK